MKKAVFYLILALLSLPTFGQTSLVLSNCGSTVPNPDTYIYCNLVSSAQEYKFEIREGGSLVQEVVSVDNKIQLSEFSGIYGRTYSIKVAAKVGGILSSYGTACNVSIDFPTTSLVSSNCGVTIQDANQYLYCFSHPSAQGYKFEITPTGGAEVQYSSTTNKFRLSDALTPQPGLIYIVKATGKYGGNYAPFGSACNVTLAFPTTSLVSSDCGATVTADQYLYCTSISGVTAYKFEITPAGGTATSKEFTSNKFRLLDIITVDPLTTYTVKVAAKIGGAVGPYGTACTVTTTGFITRLVDSNCDKTITGGDQVLYCLKDNTAEAYTFEVTPAGESPVTKEFTINSFKLSDILTQVKGSTTYTVRAKAKFSGTYAPYGTACNVITPGTTSLVTNSCNINVSSMETILYATILQDVTNYSFKVTEGTTLVGTYETTINRLKLSDVNGKFGRTYSVSVAVKRTGSTAFGDYGDVCTVTTPSLPITSMVPNDCDVTLTDTDKTLYCMLASGALAYKFEITPEGGTPVYHEVSTNKFKLADVLTPQSQTTYSIRVLGKFTNGYGDYSKVCKVTTPPIVTPEFTLHSNGVTCLCPNAKVGDKGYVNGKTYTKRTKDQITPENAALTCTSGITDMSQLFSHKEQFNEDISSWDVSSVTTMEGMFYAAKSFNQPIGIWDVSKVTDMSGMFVYAYKFNQPIGSWNTSSLKTTKGMFYNAIIFNQPLESWNVSNVTDMSSMFRYRCGFNQPLGKWNVKNVTNMNEMFALSIVFNQDLSGWCVSQISTAPTSFSKDSPLTNANMPKWGQSCTPKSKLVDTQCNTNIATPATVLYCLKYSDVETYKFELSDNGTVVGTFENTTNTFKLTDANGTYGKSYSVRVALKRTGDTAFDDYGDACTVTVPAAPIITVLDTFNNVTLIGGEHVVYCQRDVTAQEYKFEITPNGGTSKTITSSSNNFKLSDAFNPVPAATDFSVKVAGKFYGTYAPLGDAKTIKTPSVSRLVDTQCGKKINDVNTLVYCFLQSDVTNYKFEVSEKGKIISTYETTTNKFKLSDVNGIDHNKYSIRVAVKRSGKSIYGDFGPACVVYMGDYFYTHSNGVTCLCPNAEIGDTWEFKGKTFTKRSKDQITSANASTTCTSGITDMNNLITQNQFDYSFNADISHWDVSSVTDMGSMFWYAGSFNQDLKYWDVSNVTNMLGMFARTNVFNGDISTWNVSKVTDMTAMFGEAYAFNRDISKWDVSNVTKMASMFANANKFNKDISGWNVSKVTDMNHMFAYAWAFNQNIGGWNVSNVTDMGNMFDDARVFNQDIGRWDVSNVTVMKGMLHKTYLFNQYLGGWCVKQFTAEPNIFSENNNVLSDENKPNWGKSCLPKSQVVANQCDTNIATPATVIYCLKYSDVIKYKFEITDNGSPVGTYETDTNSFTLSDAKGNYGKTYNVRVALKRSGDTAFDSYGKGCTVTTPAAPTNSLLTNSCDVKVTGGDQILYCSRFLSAEGYRFEITPKGGTTKIHESTDNKFKLSDVYSPVPVSTQFTVRVANKFGGVYTPYATACTVTTPDAPKIVSTQCNGSVADANSLVYCYIVQDATYYKFEVSEKRKVIGTYETTTNKFKLSDVNGIDHNKYSIRVAVKRTGSSVYDDYGPACTVKTGPVIYLAPNGVTCLCPHAEIGEEEVVNGKTYMRRTKDQITESNAATTCTTGITNMVKLFNDKANFNGDISSWDTSSVTSMQEMFSGAAKFNQNIGSWDTSKVTDMTQLFWGASSFDQPIGNWNTSNVTNMSGIFAGTPFNHPIGNWDVGKVKYLTYAFTSTTAFNQPLNNWNTSSVTHMTVMFYGAKAFNQPLNNWNTSNVELMDMMFMEAKVFNGAINDWDVSKVTDMRQIFQEATAFNQPLDKWKFKAGAEIKQMFSGATSFNQPLANWDVSKINNLNGVFYGATSFNQPLDSWDVSNVFDFTNMFYYATSFNQPLANWDVSYASGYKMLQMFAYASAFNQDLSKWCVANQPDYGYQFSYNSGLTTEKLPKWGVACKPRTKLVTNQCGITLTSANTIVYCEKVTDAEQYRFQLRENGNNVGLYTTPNNSFTLSDVQGTYGKTYEVRVAIKRSGDEAFDSYGKSCALTTPSAPTPSLFDTNCNTTVYGGDQLLYSIKDILTEGYKFEVTPANGNATIYESTDNKFKLSDVLTVSPSTTYTVKVAYKFGGNYTAYGPSCTVTTPAVIRIVDNQCNASIATPEVVIYCYRLTDATNYRFELSEGNTVVGTFDTDVNKFKLSDANGTYGKTYNVRVAVKRTGAADYGDFGPVCTATIPPLPTTSLVTNNCNSTVSGGDQILYCYKNLAAEGYKFEVTPANGTASIYETTDNKFKLSDVFTSVAHNTTYTVRAAGKYTGIYAPYGTSCTVTTPDVTRLVDTQCGSSVGSAQSLVYCYIKSNVTNYKFEVSQAGKVIGTYETNTNKFKLADAGGVDARLYSVRVALKYSGSSVYGDYGSACKVASSKFYLHDNGVTCMCPDATVGDTGMVKGVTYTKRTKDQITEANAATTCTSGITDMSRLFYSDKYAYLPYSNYFNADVSTWDTSSVTTMERMFSYADKFNQDISNWNVSKVTNMSSMFSQAKSFNQDISKWDVSAVTTMSSMFSGAIAFNQPIGNWDMSSVTYMGQMFYYASSFNQPIGNWNVSKVTNMTFLFYHASSFNQPIGTWNTSNVVDMMFLFCNASSFNQPIGTWNTSKVTSMQSMFDRAISFDQPIGDWNVSKVKNMNQMFSGATSFNQPIGNWDVSNTPSMYSLFYGATSFNQSLKKWCVSHISSEPSDFAANSGLSTENKPNWGGECAITNPNFYLHSNGVTCMCPNAAIGERGAVNGVNYTKRTRDQITEANAATTCTSGITDMSRLFQSKSNFNGDISTWDVSNVTDMSNMFLFASKFNQPIGNWNLDKVITMEFMFAHSTTFNQPLANWDMSKVNYLRGLFYNATSFNQPIGNWDVSQVTNMNLMFYHASAFNQPIGNWNVSKVADMGRMFEKSTSFNQPLTSWCVSQITSEPQNFALDSPLSSSNKPNWGAECAVNNPNFYLHSNGVTCMCPNASIGEKGTVNGVTYTKRTKAQITESNAATTCTSGITEMSNMFSFKSNFNGNISTWDVSQVTNMASMFYSALAFNQEIGNWDVSNVTNMSGMFYDTSLFNQSLTNWCVSHIGAEPINFSNYSSLSSSNKPKWGTCSSPRPSFDENESAGVVEVRAYPNPFVDGFSISYVAENEEMVSIEIYDMQGRVVEQSVTPANEVNVQVYGQSLGTGIYNVVLTKGENTHTLRLIKN